ncbi:MAG: hypothetical protein R3F59_22610 [Myxococcota bacterium]
MLLALTWLLACSGGAEAPAPSPSPGPKPEVHVAKEPTEAPTVAFAPGHRDAATTAPLPATPDLVRVRGILEGVVQQYGRDRGNPWAIVHAMLALGPTMTMPDGSDPVDFLFATYADEASIGPDTLVTFPRKKGRALVEPHTDLVLKALTEAGFQPDRKVVVQGQEHTLGDLYRYSLHRAWAKGMTTGFQEGGYNDSAWALQGLSAWAPPDLAWTAAGGRKMTMKEFTTAVIDQLTLETKDMVAARDAGQVSRKDTRQGLYRYTCGGQHLVQGVAYAVARGFGEPDDTRRVCDQLDLLVWRIDVELNSIDPMLSSPAVTPPIATLLLSQRLKFLGHWLETVHKIAALGVCELKPEHEAASRRVAGELVRTVDGLDKIGVWKDVGAVRGMREFDDMGRDANQVFLDLVGDSAHAVRGLDLATGKGTIRY